MYRFLLVMSDHFHQTKKANIEFALFVFETQLFFLTARLDIDGIVGQFSLTAPYPFFTIIAFLFVFFLSVFAAFAGFFVVLVFIVGLF